MTSLQDIVDAQVAAVRVPGAVALVAGGDDVVVATAGVRAIGGERMTRDSLFRLASISKPIVAAATMALIDRGRLGLDEPVVRWLPELADAVVLRRPTGHLTTSSPRAGVDGRRLVCLRPHAVGRR